MTRQPQLHEVFRDIVGAMSFPISYETATDNGDGTYTLGGIHNLEHLQPGAPITIDGNDFIVKDYTGTDCPWEIILQAGSNSLPAAPNTFELYPVYFFHGTPMLQEAELKKIDSPVDKVPMVYLLEPYEAEEDNSFDSSIAIRARVKLCFLTEAQLKNMLTDDIYHNAISPMVNLKSHFMKVLEESNLFNNESIKLKTKNHTKFGIKITDMGVKEFTFSELLAGCSIDLYLEMYRIEDCACGPGRSIVDLGNSQMVIVQSGDQIDQTGGGESYGVLAGDVDGVNDIFTVSANRYRRIKWVSVAGTLRYAGDSWQQFNPATGKVKVIPAPFTGDKVIVCYE